MCSPFTLVPIEKTVHSHLSQLKNTFHCFSAATLIPQLRQLKRAASMKGLAHVPGVIGGQQLGARAGERLEEKKQKN